MISFADHAPVEDLYARDGQLLFGSEPVAALAERLGSTPFYACSRGAIAARLAALRAALPSAVKLHYALKANPLPGLLSWMAERVDGFDCASAGEIELAIAAGLAGRAIGFAGPGKTAHDFDTALARAVTVTIESPRQLSDLIARATAGAAARRGAISMPKIAIRVNPDHVLRATGMQMGGGASAFGVDQEAVPELIETAARAGVPVVGLHFYAGSQSLSAEHIAHALRAHTQAALALIGAHRQPWQWLNLGGGFGVPYAAGERALELGPIALALDESLRALGDARGGIELRLELGRYLVADAGVYVCRVLDRKMSRGTLFCIVDGGLHHNLAATGNFGQVIKRPYPLAIANRLEPRDRLIRADVVGPLCTPLDCFGRNVALPEFEPGDLLAVFRSGAYGASASPGRFLGHPACAEVLTD